MRRCCTAVIVCAVVAGCDGVPRSTTGPQPGGDAQPPSASYAVTGRVQDVDGIVIAAALVDLVPLDSQSPSRTTQSDSLGQFRFDNVGGAALLRVSKSEYVDGVQNLYVAADQALTVTLRRRVSLVVGMTLRATVMDPPCDTNWDGNAPCYVLSFVPPATGNYELFLTWDGPNELDLLIDGSLYFESTLPGEIRATVAGEGGVGLEIRIHSYYGPQAFELTVSPR